MKIENIKNIKIKIANFHPFEFTYEELSSVECQFDNEESVTLTIKPNETANQKKFKEAVDKL